VKTHVRRNTEVVVPKKELSCYRIKALKKSRKRTSKSVQKLRNILKRCDSTLKHSKIIRKTEEKSLKSVSVSYFLEKYKKEIAEENLRQNVVF